MLEEVSVAATDRLNWQAILRHFIRFPRASGGWERQALAHFYRGPNRAIRGFADIPEFAELRKAPLPLTAAQTLIAGKRTEQLRQKYVDLERKLTRYRYP